MTTYDFSWIFFYYYFPFLNIDKLMFKKLMSYFQTKVRYHSSHVLFKIFFSVMSAFYWQNYTVTHELLKVWNLLFSTFFISTIMTRAFSTKRSSEIWIIITSKYNSSAFLTIQIEWENFELKLWQCLVKKLLVQLVWRYMYFIL